MLTTATGGGSLQTCKPQPPTPGSSTQILSYPPDPLRACRGGLRCPKGAGGPVLLQRLQGTVGVMITGPQNLLARPQAPRSPHQGHQPRLGCQGLGRPTKMKLLSHRTPSGVPQPPIPWDPRTPPRPHCPLSPEKLGCWAAEKLGLGVGMRGAWWLWRAGCCGDSLARRGRALRGRPSGCVSAAGRGWRACGRGKHPGPGCREAAFLVGGGKAGRRLPALGAQCDCH